MDPEKLVNSIFALLRDPLLFGPATLAISMAFILAIHVEFLPGDGLWGYLDLGSRIGATSAVGLIVYALFRRGVEFVQIRTEASREAGKRRNSIRDRLTLLSQDADILLLYYSASNNSGIFNFPGLIDPVYELMQKDFVHYSGEPHPYATQEGQLWSVFPEVREADFQQNLKDHIKSQRGQPPNLEMIPSDAKKILHKYNCSL